MLAFIFDFIYNSCFGLKKKATLDDAFTQLEDLSDEDPTKIIKYYDRSKCC